MKWEEAAIMPDHMHALIRMQGGHQRLGDVIGGFKAAVTREIRRTGDTCVAHTCVAHTCVAHTCVAHTCVAHTCV
ncbi:MAG: transposase, partial [Kiritimatiellae bacterium]|nr:transposase [Kiritimatiellia bacterium]